MQPAFLVIGAAHWDLVARAWAPLSPGADVPGEVRRRPGGVALNIALGLAASLPGPPGAVDLVTALGRDAAGDELARIAEAAGIGTRGVFRHAGSTDRYVAIEAPEGGLHAAVADCGGLERAGTALLSALDERRVALPASGMLVLDGNLPETVIERAARHPAAAAARLAVVPASPAKAASLAPTLARILAARPVTLYLNRAEAEALTGAPFRDSHAAALALVTLGAEAAVVTDGPAPATHADAAETISLAPPAVAVAGVTGAGDAFVARHLAARVAGLAPAPALCAALAAAARHVAHPAPSRDTPAPEVR